MESNRPTVHRYLELTEIKKIFCENFTGRQDSNNDFLLRLLVVVGTVIASYASLLSCKSFAATN